MNTDISELGVGATAGVATFAVIEGGADRCVSSGSDEAELIAQCTAFIANRAALNIYMGELDGQDNIFWHRYLRAFESIRSIRATTLIGLLAKAEAAIAEGTQPDGSVDYEAGWSPALIQDLMADMHAMLRESAPASMPLGGAARQIFAMGGDAYLDALRAVHAATRQHSHAETMREISAAPEANGGPSREGSDRQAGRHIPRRPRIREGIALEWVEDLVEDVIAVLGDRSEGDGRA